MFLVGLDLIVICACVFLSDLFSSCKDLMICDCSEIFSWSDVIWMDKSSHDCF